MCERGEGGRRLVLESTSAFQSNDLLLQRHLLVGLLRVEWCGRSIWRIYYAASLEALQNRLGARPSCPVADLFGEPLNAVFEGLFSVSGGQIDVQIRAQLCANHAHPLFGITH